MSSGNESNTPADGTNANQEGGGNSNPVDSNQQSAARPSTRKPVRNRDSKNDTKTFKGETGKMNGHVFQTHPERKEKSQFEDTMEALMIYESSVYKSDIESMNILFTELKTPTVAKPEDPEETITTDTDGNKTKTVSRLEETIYNERVKQWIRDKRSLKASLRSLYNIVCGQCSKMMCEKLTMIKTSQR